MVKTQHKRCLTRVRSGVTEGTETKAEDSHSERQTSSFSRKGPSPLEEAETVYCGTRSWRFCSVRRRGGSGLGESSGLALPPSQAQVGTIRAGLFWSMGAFLASVCQTETFLPFNVVLVLNPDSKSILESLH